MAHPMGFYARHGLDVEVVKTAGWAVVRDKTLNKEYDAAHMLSPMPLAITLGAGATAIPYTMPAVENINGQAITLAMRHKDKRDPKLWKGFKFAVPFDYSMHNYLLRYFVAEHGIDPDKDIQIRVVPPPEMVANLRAGNLDGFLAPDPFNQRAVFEEVGFIWMLSKDIWPGHPCCAFAAKREFAEKAPNTFKALLNAIVDATQHAHDQAQEAARNEHYAELLAQDVWDLDRDSAARTVQLIADSEQYEEVSVALVDGTEFADSHTRSAPVTLQVDHVIPGWKEALQRMKEGSKWRLFVPSKLAYGEQGAGAEIPPDTTLIFEVELISVQSGK